jgi:hypothetical protein
MEFSTQEDAAAALTEALKRARPRSGGIPHLEKAFVVDRKGLTLSINYVPENKINCVIPPDAVF